MGWSFGDICLTCGHRRGAHADGVGTGGGQRRVYSGQVKCAGCQSGSLCEQRYEGDPVSIEELA